jgi:hypothetical protein
MVQHRVGTAFTKEGVAAKSPTAVYKFQDPLATLKVDVCIWWQCLHTQQYKVQLCPFTSKTQQSRDLR